MLIAYRDLMTYMGLVLLSYSLVNSVGYFPVFGPQYESAVKIIFQGDSSTRFFNILKCSMLLSVYTVLNNSKTTLFIYIKRPTLLYCV